MEQTQPEKNPARRSFFDRVPPYVFITFIYVLTIDLLVFYATRPILPYLPAHTLAMPLDGRIPFMPAWIIIYVLSFASWLITVLWILSESKRHAYRLCGVYTIIMILTLTCFLAYPVTIERPEITESGLFHDFTRLIYALDSPTNLCPSLHVVLSYICWRGTMDCKKIPKWYQWFNLAFLVLVCFSILFVKQHYVIDIPVALIITEGALQIGRATRIERIGFAIEERYKRRKEGSV